MRRTVLAWAVLLGLALAPYPQPPADASCAAPMLEVQGAEDPSPVVLHRGEEVTVAGRGFVEGCDDGGGESAFGCSGNDEGETPMTDVELVLLSGGPTMKQASLGMSDAGRAVDGQLGRITWTFTVPEEHPLGRAFLKTEGSEPLPVRVRR